MGFGLFIGMIKEKGAILNLKMDAFFSLSLLESKLKKVSLQVEEGFVWLLKYSKFYILW